ncbi:MAG: hypothetical protein DRN12_02955 [Thermoplasmata archaeon]|nr:MAG: hypothetical protein DRN12_02955 [Thermoplasmata archaeon]
MKDDITLNKCYNSSPDNMEKELDSNRCSHHSTSNRKWFKKETFIVIVSTIILVIYFSSILYSTVFGFTSTISRSQYVKEDFEKEVKII